MQIIGGGGHGPPVPPYSYGPVKEGGIRFTITSYVFFLMGISEGSNELFYISCMQHNILNY